MESALVVIGRKDKVFKDLIISEPVYIATMQHVPNNALNDLQNLHKEFIWGGKRPKITHCTLIREYEDYEYEFLIKEYEDSKRGY